jgi:aspartyl-tRNA(Asn)/glutamyl-tRNA(Gln) amidotransferase subunit C
LFHGPDPEDIDRIAIWRAWSSKTASASACWSAERIFGIVEQMRAVDTTGVEPLAHPLAAIQDAAAPARGRGQRANQREANQQSAGRGRRPVPGAQGDRMSGAACTLQRGPTGRRPAPRQVSAVELAQHFLARIQQHADLGAFLAVDEDATLAQAQPPTRLAAGEAPC